MIFDWQSAEKMQCSRKEKDELVSLIDLLVQASEKSRREGLLALEDDIDEYMHPLLKLGMQFVVDGTDPDIIQSILTSRILSENKRGRDFLEQIIICDGVLSIQSGDNPRIIMVKCFSYLGEDADELLEKYMSEEIESRESKLVENYMDADGTVVECVADMRKVLSLNDRAVQKILREVDTSELAVILEGSDSDVRTKMLRNMSQRAARLLVAGEIQSNPSPDAVKKNVKKLFEIIAKLEKAGEITSPE